MFFINLDVIATVRTCIHTYVRNYIIGVAISIRMCIANYNYV